MCGICGKLSWDKPPEKELIELMNRRLIHRGPDSGGIAINGPVVLGHRRLSIIDLSLAGNQPMSDISGNYLIVFNGEIYNFIALRQELAKLGAEFQSRTDTEVILEAYKQWGVDCLKHFNGMFAFALWDSLTRKLFIARDRLGKKPLFYQPLKDGGISFASELKALIEDTEVSQEINPTALHHYLSLNYTLTAECILKGVRKLPAAHYLLIEQDNPIKEECYWDLATHFRQKRTFRSEEEAAEELRELIDDAVRLRLVSDVPLGVFLSGGVDSSTIVAAMLQTVAATGVHSFSLGFREKGFSELAEAGRVAALLGSQHREILALPDAAELLDKMAYYADEPFADTSMIPTYLLAEFTRKYVTVSLSGDGGDELFAGYETYVADKLHHYTRGIPDWLSKMLYLGVNRYWPVSHGKVSFDYKLRQFLQGHAYSAPQAHYHWRTIFSEQEKRELLLPPFNEDVESASPLSHFLKYQQEVADCHYLDQAMYVDIKTWLVDNILVKVDRMTMAHSLEARAPFLDYRIMEFAAALPIKLKLKGFRKKYLLKKSQDARLPREILEKKKKGFNAPVSHWINSSLQEKFRELTTTGAFTRSPQFFNSRAVERLWVEHQNKTCDHSLKLLGVINFHLWCSNYLTKSK